MTNLTIPVAIATQFVSLAQGKDQTNAKLATRLPRPGSYICWTTSSVLYRVPSLTISSRIITPASRVRYR